MNKEELLKENQELKKQYCERTDCSARLGTSKKVEALEKENQQLKEENRELRADYGSQAQIERDLLLIENKELKSQLKGTTHCFDEEEHERLKKQLHEASLTIQEMIEQTLWCPSSCDKLEKLTTQQKVFIKYLEDESKEIYRDGGLRQNIFRQILQKYKEIVNETKRN